MEVAVELEDDLFFADLSKEIALLIMDEDEDPLDSSPPHSLQVLLRLSSLQTSNFKHMHHAYFFPLIIALWGELSLSVTVILTWLN